MEKPAPKQPPKRKSKSMIKGKKAPECPTVTDFQASILSAFPAGNPKAKKDTRTLTFFVLRKILGIDSPRSVRNLRSSLDCLVHKGYLHKDSQDDHYAITDRGIQWKCGMQAGRNQDSRT